MFARTVARSVRSVAPRTVRPSFSQTAIAARGFKSGLAARDPETVQEKSVPVVSYTDGQRTQEVLQVSEASQPVSPPGQDEEVAAVPLNPSVLSQLTPTMLKFTCPGKVAMVTGGGRGLGYNMAQALSEVGVRGIAIMDVQQELGDKSARVLSEQTGVDVRFYKVDVRDGHAIQQAVHDVVAHYGQLDVVINAAGIADSNIKAETYDPEKFRRLLDINITGSFLVAQAAGQQMIKLKTGGSIINIASMSGSIVNYPQEQSAYNASKAAVIQLTKSLAAEWARHGIRVNAISPGYMDTALNRVPALDAQKRIWIDNTPRSALVGNTSIESVESGYVFLAPITIAGQDFYTVIDTGSSDTWLVAQEFTCLDASTGETQTEDLCYFGPPYIPSPTFQQIPSQNFNISYADGEFLTGIMGYENMTFATIKVPQQEMAVVDYAAWIGDGVSSGLVGLAYPFLTNAYPGNDPTADDVRPHGPLFSLALSRDPENAGYLALGGIANVSHSEVFVSSAIDIIGVNRTDGTPVYEFYTIVLDGWAVSADRYVQFNPYPNANPAKSRLRAGRCRDPSGAELRSPGDYDQSQAAWFVECDAVPPVFGAVVGKKVFYVNPADMVVNTGGGQCISGVQPDMGGLSILGDTWLRNVLAVFDVGAGEMRFAARSLSMRDGRRIGEEGLCDLCFLGDMRAGL
ncbi:hypothetical protein H2203_007934 [Taxawa tesnikishii (nom. ined.)]|nr:hypothetical protein H2203_007934 [Dothideales sp. JES 119]